MIGAIAAVMVVTLLLAGAWSLVSPNAYAPSRDGCVNVVAAVSTGGSLLHECGAAAVTWCESEYALEGNFDRLVQAQCRLAGIEPLPTFPRVAATP